MKRRLLSTSLLLGLTLTPLGARADFIATATLSGAQQVPSVASPGTGTATVMFQSAPDDLLVHLDFSGLTSGAIAGHIHFGAAGVNGPIVLPFNLGTASGMTSGMLDLTLTAADLIPSPTNGINTFADIVAAIQAGNAYVNLHTMNFIGGEIRGQLALVPEPGPGMLVASGLLVLAVRRRQG